MSDNMRSPLLGIQGDSRRTPGLADETQHTDQEDEKSSPFQRILARKPVYIAVLAVMTLTSLLVLVVALKNWKSGFAADLVQWPKKGITLTNGRFCSYVRYDDPRSMQSLSSIKITGANWVQVMVSEYQLTINSTTIQTGTHTATTQELEAIMKKAKLINMNVSIAYELTLPTYEPTTARREIGLDFDNSTWEQWFSAYEARLLVYAAAAQRAGADLLVVGLELSVASQQDVFWRELVKKVRRVFSGQLTYGAVSEGEETSITWWDALDVIGVQAYYDVQASSASAVVKQWQPIIHSGVGSMSMGLRNLANKYKLGLVFTRLAYCSGPCPTNPQGTIDLKGQQTQYEGFMLAFGYLEVWFHGAFFFNWDTDPGFGGQDNYCSTPVGKPAEQVLRDFYGAADVRASYDKPAECACVI